MARPLRIDFEGAFHHVTNRGARRQDIFYCDDDRLDLVHLLETAHKRFGIVLHSFCFMTNHVHLIIETPEGNLSKALHLIESSYVQKYNRRHGIDGPLLKGRFHSRLIEEDDYLQRAIVYVERNPIEAGIVDNLEDYPWSSFRMFLDPTVNLPIWLSDRALGMCGIRTRRQLRDLIMSSDPKDTLELEKFPTVIGSDDFIAAALIRAESCDETIGHIRSSAVRPDIVQLEKAIGIVFDIDPSTLRERTQGTQHPARIAAVGLGQELAGLPLATIASRYGFSTSKSAGVIASRYRKRLPDNELFALRVEQVRQLLLDGRNATADRAC